MTAYRIRLVNGRWYVVNADGHGVADFRTIAEAHTYIGEVTARQQALREATR